MMEAMNMAINTSIKAVFQLISFTKYTVIKKPMIERAIKLPFMGPGRQERRPFVAETFFKTLFTVFLLDIFTITSFKERKISWFLKVMFQFIVSERYKLI